ncbi:MAG TPA: 30S ribosomal protein S16, partial [Bacteroidales bacterium]|nr:30S ribosomal protein S16 [Bacteroidales bacterium]
MAVKIRLARKGRKRKAFYHIVVADSRAPRDGRFIEKLGVYNPVTDPATIELDFDKALGWLQKGAQPTDTCRAILSYKGVMLKKHLLEGVRKGAFDEAEAERRFQVWLKEKEGKIEAKKSDLEKSKEEDKKKRLETEKKINEERAEALAKKRAELAEQESAGEQPVEEKKAETSDSAAEK